MAKRLSLNEGSLLRRTLLHIAVFVLGTAAFIALASLVLTVVADKLLSSGSGDHADSASEENTPSAASTGKPNRPPRRKGKLTGTSPVAPAADPAKTDDEEE